MVNINRLSGSQIPDKNLPNLSVVTGDTLTTYFNTERYSQYLFPHERMLVNSCPYKLMECNIPIIMGNSDITEIYTDFRAGNEEYRGLLSVGTVYPVIRPSYAYNLEIYGEDNDSLETHIQRHLKRMVDKAAGDTSLFVCINDKLSDQIIDQIFAKYKIQRYRLGKSNNSETDNVKRVLYEASGARKSRY